MKSVLISIKPQWCALIANGRKTIEVRKTRPKLEPPFKCYIYQTVGGRTNTVDILENNLGKVIGEFICNKIDRLTICGYDNSDMKLRRVDDNLTAYNLDYDYLNKCRLLLGELENYANGSELFGWHISNIVIYDKPKKLSEFWNADKCPYARENGCTYEYYCFRAGKTKRCGQQIERPPQSWCYVKEVEE